MSKCLIVTCGFFGDIFFQSSIAKKLKEESQFDVVDYLIGFPQISRLILNNPFIDSVMLPITPSAFPSISSISTDEYDEVFQMKTFSFIVPPTIECQTWANVNNPSSDFEIFTCPEYDKEAEDVIGEIRSKNNKPVVAIPADWEDRTFIFTEEQYKKGEDPKNIMGYGGKRRNVVKIKEALSEAVNIFTVGLPLEIKQNMTTNIPENHKQSILFECSLLKACDAFIGSEGGMCNMASGVGTKTIITGDFVHQLYGYNGSVRKIPNPKLGPVHYFKDRGHVELDPYISDEQVVEQILNNIKSGH